MGLLLDKKAEKLIPWVFCTLVEPPGQGGIFECFVALVTEILFCVIRSRPSWAFKVKHFSLRFLEDSFSSSLRATQEGWGGAESINILSSAD